MNRSTRSVSLCRVLPAMNSITMKSAPFDLVDFVDGDDVGVVPRGGGFGFLNEALLAGLVFHFLRMEHLDADEPVEPQDRALYRRRPYRLRRPFRESGSARCFGRASSKLRSTRTQMFHYAAVYARDGKSSADCRHLRNYAETASRERADRVPDV